MDQKIKNGKIEKPRSIYDQEFSEEFQLDDALKKELEDQELEYRFIDWKQAKINGGRSRSGWIVYKRQSAEPTIGGLAPFADTDGLVRQGTTVLAVKTKRNAERQRDKVRAANLAHKKYEEAAAQELQDQARGLGGTKVISGYDKNG